jgi:hypothetical protein
MRITSIAVGRVTTTMPTMPTMPMIVALTLTTVGVAVTTKLAFVRVTVIALTLGLTLTTVGVQHLVEVSEGDFLDEQHEEEPAHGAEGDDRESATLLLVRHLLEFKVVLRASGGGRGESERDIRQCCVVL